ncbi:NUDIX hydrolase [Balneolales bacterium ANBcel1]|nr:NUDIX hydrolase [Balneolales bacterium ANBcel1]
MNAKESPRSLEEKRISSEKIFSGTLLHVYRDQARLPDGGSSVREWIDHPGASAVLPVFETGEVQLVRQFRYPLQEHFLEVPAGKIDPGEDPMVTAKRELKEEAGVRGNRWLSLGPFHPCIGYTNEVIHLYLAWELETFENHVDEDEFLEPVRLPFKEAVSMALNGELTDGKTVTNILRGAHWWKKHAPFPVDLP